MWKTLVDRLLQTVIQHGDLTVTYPDGTKTKYGDGTGAAKAFAIKDDATLRALCLTPELGLGEAYMDARVIVENDDLDGLMALLVDNRRTNAMPFWNRISDMYHYVTRDIRLRNTTVSARQNVSHHYDISDKLYALFLDADMQYSCAYFTEPDMSLEDAQVAKKRHIARKLQIEPGMTVLDIGCGWGGMALTLALDFGACVTGVTLSKNQLATAQRRAEEAGLSDRIEFKLLDYRKVDGPFDRVVSVGMLEHVGVPHYAEYFSKVADVMGSDGVALIHTIGRSAPPTRQSAWINKYIFPGGYVPSLSELARPIEDAQLWQLDLEVWRLHYAYTLRHWRDRFEANLETVRKDYDERFVRMWRYYLTVCIMAFEVQPQAVFQFQLGHKRDVVPITRDYLYGPQSAQSRAAE